MEDGAFASLNLALGGPSGLEALNRLVGQGDGGPCSGPAAYSAPTTKKSRQPEWTNSVLCRDGKVVSVSLDPRSGAGGSLPTQIGLLSTLEELRFSQGRIKGTIPTQLMLLQGLRVLSAESQQISGSIPTQIANLRQLSVLDLNDNRIKGHVPAGLFAGTLRRVDLYDNLLSGWLPTQVGKAAGLMRLGLEEHRISGWVPTQLGNVGNLKNLNAEHGSLSGVVPSELARLSLRAIDLDWQQHKGKHPSWLVRRKAVGQKLGPGASQGAGFRWATDGRGADRHG